MNSMMKAHARSEGVDLLAPADRPDRRGHPGPAGRPSSDNRHRHTCDEAQCFKSEPLKNSCAPSPSSFVLLHPTL
jgi:hypothetical protein